MKTLLPAQFNLTGPIYAYLHAITEQWLLVAPMANPAMLEMFADRDTRPYRNLLPWSGEFAGKYLTAAVQVWRVTRDPRLGSLLRSFVARLISLQDADGYLGPWPRDCRLTNHSPHHGANGLLTWDTWGHYHLMTGLLLWTEEIGDAAALECVLRIADLICQKYLGSQRSRLVDTGSTEMNLAPVHGLAKLYRMTGIPRYLEMALQIVAEFTAFDEHGLLAGDYLRQALTGKALYEMPRPRWESLHAIMGLAELYAITGEAQYRQAFEQIWWGIVQYDRHNNGGFSSGEQATGNPYHPGTIETCCTIAWLAMSVEMLKMTGLSISADEIELSTLNSVLGMHSPTGRWSTFTTPMDGARFASSHAIGFQARSGSPELNCCSVNSPRGLGLISEWAVMQEASDVTLNYYGPCDLRLTLGDDLDLEIRQETEYPISGRIRILVTPKRPAVFTLRLRLPYWSQDTHLALNGQYLPGVRPGCYYPLQREWQAGDCLEMDLDLSLHYWRGERECQGLVSVFRGPLLLAYDQRYNRSLAVPPEAPKIPDDPFKVTRELLPVPLLEINPMSLQPVDWTDWFPPLLLLETRAAQGHLLRLCDFASAGATGTLYRTWLPAKHAPRRMAFSRINPLRSSQR